MPNSVEPHPLVSYVIPVYNREQEIQTLVESLGNQTYPRTETVVVDDGSDDKSGEVAGDALTRLNMKGRVIRNEHNMGRQKARDIGLIQSAGAFVWFLDSDMILPREATEKCVAVCLAENLDGVMIPERSIGTGIWAKCRGLEKRINDFDLEKMSIRFVKRDIAVAVGGHATNHVADDYDFQNRVVKAGIRYRLLVETAIQHKELESVKGMLRKFYRYGRTMPVYVQKYPKESFRQFVPLRPAYLKALKLFWEYPSITVAFFGLKSLQLAASLAGALISVVTTKTGSHAN